MEEMTEEQIASGAAAMLREMRLTAEERAHVIGMSVRLTEIYCEFEKAFFDHTGDGVRAAFVVRCACQVSLKIFKGVCEGSPPRSAGSGDPAGV